MSETNVAQTWDRIEISVSPTNNAVKDWRSRIRKYSPSLFWVIGGVRNATGLSKIGRGGPRGASRFLLTHRRSRAANVTIHGTSPWHYLFSGHRFCSSEREAPRDKPVASISRVINAGWVRRIVTRIRQLRDARSGSRPLTGLT